MSAWGSMAEPEGALRAQPWEWTEKDILAIVRENEPETLTLEYKAAGALGKQKKVEIGKDVSAMANSAGGTIIYGIDEQKALGGPLTLSPVDTKEFSTEWLVQVIDSNIQRRIPGLRVRQIPIGTSTANMAVYVVWVPQSSFAPHMAADKCYYKRNETTTAKMEEYEVRDASRRSQAPDLEVEVAPIVIPGSLSTLLRLWIRNVNEEPAFYATCRFYIPLHEARYITAPHPDLKLQDERDIWFENGGRQRCKTYALSWAVPNRPALLVDEKHDAGYFSVSAGFSGLHIGLEVRAPKMPTKTYAVFCSATQMEKMEMSFPEPI